MANPETAPPRNAAESASRKLVRLPAADRRFALMEICIPTYPDSALSVAPRAKAPAVFSPRTGLCVTTRATAKTTATMAAMRAIVTYCRRRKARAPSWIACAISCIFGVPVGRRSTSRARKAAKPRAAAPERGITRVRSTAIVAGSGGPNRGPLLNLTNQSGGGGGVSSDIEGGGGPCPPLDRSESGGGGGGDLVL